MGVDSGSGFGAAPDGVLEQEHRLRRDLGYVALTAINFSNIVGSGWLFAAQFAAQTAGPAALVSWIGAGVLCTLVALVMMDLGARHPEGGGTVRWPLYASGRLVGTVVGWSMLLSVGGTAAEITAILQYAAHYLPELVHDRRLTGVGLVSALVLGAILTALNWFAVRIFARFNSAITVFKIVIPLVTAVAVLVAGLHPGRMTGHGGFAPYGWSACLTALTGSGIVYSLNGFQAGLDFSGESRNPRRVVPLATLSGIVLALAMYVLLQVAFLFAVPEAMLGHGWRGVSFDSPFGELAVALSLHWLSTLLYADAVASPGGSAYVGVAIDARHTYALAKNRLLPAAIMRVDPRHGIPQRALLLNLAIIVVFLLPFDGWQNIVAVMGDLYLIGYAASAVAAVVLRRRDHVAVGRGFSALVVIAPISFVVSSEFVYWSGWNRLRIALPLMLVAVVLYVGMARGSGLVDGLREGAWLPVYLVTLLLLSWLGTPHSIVVGPKAPYDSLLVAVVSLGFYWWALRSGVHGSRDAPVDLLDSR